jgi:ATP-dependent helicase Lhr and Lhr-like helicase
LRFAPPPLGLHAAGFAGRIEAWAKGVNPRILQRSLTRTWGAFFGRYGNFTPAQTAGIPPLLDGENILLCAATASGKTEAALAPLIERYLPPLRPTPRLTLLYLLPTRALINDLRYRLAAPLDALRISSAMKTRDFDTFDPKRPADLLLTTPESLDSLLTAHASTLNAVRAVVIDEIHVFDGTVRGDQLRVLLNRLRQVRAHAFKIGDIDNDSVQYVGVSATLTQPEATAARYFPNARVIQVPGSRVINAEYLALDEDSPAALLDYLRLFHQRGWRKALVFCNTREEVEAYAVAVRAADSPFGDAIYVHYSNLSRELRYEIEERFAHAEAALCFATSTLELGIDIGDIDVVLLIGPPGSHASFIQRAGRGGRREQGTQVVSIYRTPLERILFEVLLKTSDTTVSAVFRPSVVVQQIFSLLKQSPTGAIRLRQLVDLFNEMLSPADLEAILGALQASGYLMPGRMGEWRAGDELHRLVDLQSAEHTPLSLYSNIQSSDTAQIKIRDQNTQRVVANVDRQWLGREVLTLEGRPLSVEWVDDDALWVLPHRGSIATTKLRYLSARPVLRYEVAQQIPLQIGLAAGAGSLVASDEGSLWFHWLGDVYGQALLDLVRYTTPAEKTAQIGLCLLLPENPPVSLVWTLQQVSRYLHDHYRRYERLLAFGAYHHLLPLELRRRAVVEQFDIPRFINAVANLRFESVLENLMEELQSLLR